MESALDSPAIKKFFTGILRLIPGVTLANFVDSKTDAVVPAGVTGHQENSPFVLVAHSAGGQWEVYAKDFEHPLAAFSERQAGCDFATNLAKTRDNAIVLIRESQTLL